MRVVVSGGTGVKGAAGMLYRYPRLRQLWLNLLLRPTTLMKLWLVAPLWSCGRGGMGTEAPKWHDVRVPLFGFMHKITAHKCKLQVASWASCGTLQAANLMKIATKAEARPAASQARIKSNFALLVF